MANRLRKSQDSTDALLVAAFLGGDAWELYRYTPAIYALRSGRDIDLANPFHPNLAFLVQYRTPANADEVEILAMLREAWPRLRPAVMAEWRQRGRKGLPPGAALEKAR